MVAEDDVLKDGPCISKWSGQFRKEDETFSNAVKMSLIFIKQYYYNNFVILQPLVPNHSGKITSLVCCAVFF